MSSDSADARLGHCPQPVDGIDWRRLVLSPVEGFILSRVDGATSARLIADMASMSLGEVVAALERLAAAGAIRWPTSPAPAVSPGDLAAQAARLAATLDAAPPVEPARAAALAEICDLGREEREAILALDESLGSCTHWELLDLCDDVPAAEVKRAYFAQSRRFHPDRYFGKTLGSFKPRLERIFKALKAAYEVLSDDVTRAAYAQRHPPPAIARRDATGEEGRADPWVSRVAGLVSEAAAAVLARQHRKAAEGFAAAFAARPSDVSLAVRGAEQYLEARALDSAWALVQSAIVRAPRRRDVRLTAVRVLEARGDRDGALRQAKAIADADGSDPVVDSLIERLSRPIR